MLYHHLICTYIHLRVKGSKKATRICRVREFMGARLSKITNYEIKNDFIIEANDTRVLSFYAIKLSCLNHKNLIKRKKFT